MMKTVSFFKQGLFPGVAGLFLVFTLLSCGAKENTSAAEAPAGDEASKSQDCLNGKWTAMADNVEKSFTFNEDKTGTEVNTPESTNQFKWEQKDDKVTIVYVEDPSNQKWDFTLDCEAGTLLVFGISFKK
jgi:hypothetical protein